MYIRLKKQDSKNKDDVAQLITIQNQTFYSIK